jgi:hypothetical protein
MKTINEAGEAPAAVHVDYHEIGTVSSIREGLKLEVESLVKLELTAEEMLRSEASLAQAYINDDANHFWQDFKEGMVHWELSAGELLLSAADPSRVEWQRTRWWGDDETQFH